MATRTSVEIAPPSVKFWSSENFFLVRSFFSPKYNFWKSAILEEFRHKIKLLIAHNLHRRKFDADRRKLQLPVHRSCFLSHGAADNDSPMVTSESDWCAYTTGVKTWDGRGVEEVGGVDRRCRDADWSEQCLGRDFPARGAPTPRGQAWRRRLCVVAGQTVLSGQEQHVSCRRTSCGQQRQLHVLLWFILHGARRLLRRLQNHLPASVTLASVHRTRTHYIVMPKLHSFRFLRICFTACCISNTTTKLQTANKFYDKST